MFKVIVAGTRTFEDYDYLCECLDEQILYITEENDIIDDIQIVSGGAKGADKLGERYARERGYSLKVFPAEWDKFGKSAGYRRNEQMAKYADACICFWDRQSKGTAHMITLAEKHDLLLIVNETEEGEIVTEFDEKIKRTEENQKRYEENKKNNNNVEVNPMNNNNMNNNNARTIVTYTIANRGNMSVLMNHTSNKFVKLEDKTGCTMASLRLLQAVVNKMERNDNVLNIVIVPKNLGLILKVDGAQAIKDNGYKTLENGKQLSKEFVDIMVHINELRKWLGTNNLVLKIAGGNLVNENERKLHNDCWRQLDKVMGNNSNSQFSRKPVGDKKPQMPSSLKSMAVNDFEI